MGFLDASSRLVAARALRGFSDGATSVLLAGALAADGLDGTRIGILVTATLLGSAALTLGLGLLGHRLAPRAVLLGACVLMFFTGLGFFALSSFWLLLPIAIIGTLNPSTGDVSIFLPTEQGALADLAPKEQRVALFARYAIGAKIFGAFGALVGGAVPKYGLPLSAGFAFSMGVAVACAALYLGLELPKPKAAPPKVPLEKSRPVVLKLALYFCLDSAGGGLVLESLLVLWLQRRFGMTLTVAGAVLFGTNLLVAFSQVLSVKLAARFGMIPTMVFSHLPANGFLILAALMPTAPLAVACLFCRYALTQMDVPARQAFVMSVVPPEERAAAASVTTVPRSLAAGVTPVVAGLLLDATSFGWPLIIGGAMKIAYDLLMLTTFRKVELKVS
jgi:MFS family permease